ncbi:MAG: hypothetical protein Q8M92_02470 [Candidatus Subteraquimicrobiales bacterium]|nr:hypothetical protein [Candidatus Subteraquimicrobiales bacterium]
MDKNLDKTLLTICPSRGRPDIITEMIKSFAETRGDNTDLLIYVDELDPTKSKYLEMIEPFILERGITLQFGPRLHIVEVYNKFSNEHSYNYYAPINDDHVFLTYHWDEKLIKVVETSGGGWGLAMADDLLTDFTTSMHPSGCVISGNIIRALGYMVWPKLHHIGTDTFLQKICQGVNRLFLVKDVIIEHRHWLNGRRPLDDNYKWVYGGEEQRYGAYAISNYLYNHLPDDIEKLRAAMTMTRIKND